jgi:hypothetical protein
MCGGYGDTDNDGKSDGIGAFMRDITDGGGAGRSGARFSSGDTGGLDLNQDNYISEQEYQRGQSNSESNADSGITGPIGDAYNNSRGVVSNFSNSFGALPRGSIRQEAALGPQYGTPIETKNMVRYLQMGGMPGAAIRGVSGFLGGAADAAGDMGRALTFQEQRKREAQTPEQAARSYDSIFNTGERIVPQNVIQGTRSLNPRLGRPVSVGSSIGPVTRYMDESPKARGTQTETAEPNYVFEPVTGDFLVIGPSGEVLSRIPASALNMQNQ